MSKRDVNGLLFVYYSSEFEKKIHFVRSFHKSVAEVSRKYYCTAYKFVLLCTTGVTNEIEKHVEITAQKVNYEAVKSM